MKQQKIKEFTRELTNGKYSRGKIVPFNIPKFEQDLTDLLDQAAIDILKKVARLDMLKEFCSNIEDVIDMDFEDFEDIWLSMPQIIVNNIMGNDFTQEQRKEIFKDVKLRKSSKSFEEFFDDHQTEMFLNKDREED